MDLISRYVKPWITRLLTIFVGAYVENLSTEQLDLGVARGEIDLKDLKLKKGALDKLALPFDVVEGRIGRFLFKLNWLGNSAASTPLQIEVEDVQILIAATSGKQYNKEEEGLRDQQLKQSRLARAEALRLGEATEQLSYTQSLINSIIARILNNVQISIKNVHLRYEDAEAVPEHAFAIGVTLAHLSAKTTDENWQPTYLEGKAQIIHKLVQLDSIAVYFNTDSKSMFGLSYEDSKALFREQISSNAHPVEHQYVLRPVSGVGHLVMNKNWGKDDTPHYDARLLFHELSFSLDHHQYRNIISLADEFQIYSRRRRYFKYRPDEVEFSHNSPRAMWKFAIMAVLEKIHDKNQRWTWQHFRARRDDRRRYIELFKERETNNRSEPVNELENLEKKLSYSDIRLYRSVARSQIKKDNDLSRRIEEKRKQQQSWGSWFWGTATPEPSSPTAVDTLSDEDKKELYEILDYDEKAEIAESFEVPREAISTRLKVQLQRGSFSLKTSPQKGSKDILSLLFDFFEMGGIQRRENFEILLSLGNFRVFDGTNANTVYSQIVQVNNSTDAALSANVQVREDRPFFTLNYEYKPLDDRADNGLTVYLRSMEIIYQRGYIEAVYEFFRPPESQLQSVDSFLHVAGETLEGIQKETRAGFEFALETHKTIDLRLDMHAPIIIIPESVTQEGCNHLVVDAGRILVESNLADKSVLQDIEKKRGREYTEEDYKRLETLMYDSYSVKLTSAQFVIGNSLDSCRNAMQAEQHDPRMHLLERININFLVQNSIVPSAQSIPRLKVSGMLPNMHLNFSDRKYKTLMHFLDVTIPRFKDNLKEKVTIGDSGIFGNGAQEYHINEDTDHDALDRTSLRSVSSQEALDGRQHKFELQFQVNALQATMSRSMSDGAELNLANLELDSFRLSVVITEYETAIDIGLRAINVISLVPGLKTLHLVSTKSIDDANLMAIVYGRVQSASPDFLSVYGGYDQSIEVRLSTFIFTLVPEHVLPLCDFIMATFVPQSAAGTAQKSLDIQSGKPEGYLELNTRTPISKIRLRAYLASFQIWLATADGMLTLSLSTANVEVALSDGNMNLSAKLGDLLLSSDSSEEMGSDAFKQVLSIEGDDLLELQYQSFNEDTARERGMKSRIDMTAASVKMNFLDKPLSDIYMFLMKFSRLRGLYDAAAEAAVQRASKVERMGFCLTVNSPIVILPTDGIHCDDNFTLKLGKLIAHNKFESEDQLIIATLDGLHLSSSFSHDTGLAKSKILDDVHVSTKIRKRTDAVENTNREPDLKIEIVVSDVKLRLTQWQFCKLVKRSQSIASVFSGVSREDTDLLDSNREPMATLSGDINSVTNAEMPQEISSSCHSSSKKIVLSLILPLVKLHLYDSGATDATSLKEHGIVSFAITKSKLSYELRTSGASQTDLTVASFNITNTKPGRTKFREIIPEADHGREQIRMLYIISASPPHSSQLIVTVDSPQIIYSVEPLFSLMNFSQSVLPRADLTENTASESDVHPREPIREIKHAFTYRFDLHNASLIVLEDDQEVDTRTIRLKIARFSISQQNAMIIEVIGFGMSYARMNRLVDAVRFLDDVDVTYSSETRVDAGKQVTTIRFAIEQDLVVRLSYRDILLITSVANKAISLFSNAEKDKKEINSKQIAFNNATSAVASGALSKVGGNNSVAGQRPTHEESNELNAKIRGIQFIVIGDLHEIPIFHVMVREFFIDASDWSKALYAATKLPLSIDYWNLKNSKWEPLVEPWSFTVILQKEVSSGKTSVKFQSDMLLDINITSDFAELAIIMANVWKDEKDKFLRQPRGARAPYCIRNRTGGSLCVWSDPNGNANVDISSPVQVDQGGQVDWRFEDWKTLREGGMSPDAYSIGIHFIDKPWDDLRSIPIGREGKYVYTLSPQAKHGTDKLLCEVTIKDGIKIVTLRSTYKVLNQTFYPLEVTLVDNTGHPVYPIEKIAPGQGYALPINAVTCNRLRLQPDAGFGYKWSPSTGWEDLRDVRPYTKYITRCPHMDRDEAPFHFVLWPKWTSQSRDYPQLELILRAPIEIENLLAYDIQYKVYDKDSNHTWNSFLRKGGCTPIHSVHLNHLVLLNITVLDSEFRPSDFTIINADQKFEFEQETQLPLIDSHGRKCVLNLNYVKLADAGGSFKVQIYSPYVIVNKTGLPFEVRSSRTVGITKDFTGIDARGQRYKASPYLLSHANRNGNEFVFRFDESAWSQTIRFDAPSAETALMIPHQSQNREICVGLSWSEGSGKYKLSKVIKLAPRFVVYNKLARSICFREVGGRSGREELHPGEKSPLHYTRIDERKLLTIAYPGLNAEWSPAIDMEAIGQVHVRVRDPLSQGTAHLVVANIVLHEATIYIVISAHEGSWPFIIENKCDQVILFGQTDDERDIPENDYVYKARPGERVSYAWDFPAMQKKKIFLSCNNRSRKVDIMEIGVLPPLKYNTGALSLDVRADGHTQILSITKYREETSVYKLKRRRTESVSTTLSSTTEFEAVQENVPPTFAVDVDLEGLGLSFINKRLVEIAYLSIRQLKLEYANSPVAQSVNLSCGTLQIDNQLHDAYFPVLLQPTPIAKQAQTQGALPTVQASVIIVNDSEHGVLFVKYASVLLQALTVELDEAFLHAAIDLMRLEGISWGREPESILIQDNDNNFDPSLPDDDQYVYFEVLELQPVILSVSFVRNVTSGGETSIPTSNNPLAVVVDILTMTLANAEGIELRLNALGLTDVRLTFSDIQGRISHHYRQEVLRQVYRVLGSADFLGNPVGLFTNVSSGVADMFYEPWNGVVRHGTGELGVGIAKGAASFMKKTIFGLSDSVTKVTSSLGKGLSAATLDADYQTKRRMTQRRNKPRHALTGVTAGAEALASSVASGVEGILMKPIEGADTGGAFGFIKGMGIGLVGAVTKPVVGVFDLAANVTEGIRNTTTVFDAPRRERVRKPRHISTEHALQPYSARKAQGQTWMMDLSDGKYRKEYYIAHIELPGTDTVVLLTNARILSFSSRDLRVLWDLPLTSVAGVQGEQNGIRFASKRGRDYDKFVIIQDPSAKDWFFEQVRQMVQAFNAKRRLER